MQFESSVKGKIDDLGLFLIQSITRPQKTLHKIHIDYFDNNSVVLFLNLEFTQSPFYFHVEIWPAHYSVFFLFCFKGKKKRERMSYRLGMT